MATNIDEKTVEIKVRKDSNVGSLAHQIKRFLQDGKVVRVVSIGANAVNQSVKAIAKASATPVGGTLHVSWRPSFITRDATVEETGEASTISAICMESISHETEVPYPGKPLETLPEHA